jgi:hypothetical protein
MYYKKFDCYEVFTIDTFQKTFMSEYIHTYILIDNDMTLDFISYYTIDVTAVKKNTNTIDGYMYYYTNISNNLKIMIELLLVILYNNNIDTFKALNIMDNMDDIFTDLKFINENNNMYYYMFNNINKFISNKNISNKNISNKTFAKILL